MFDKQLVQAVANAFHSEGAELNQEQAELVLRIMITNARRCLPAETEGRSDEEVLRLVAEAWGD